MHGDIRNHVLCKCVAARAGLGSAGSVGRCVNGRGRRCVSLVQCVTDGCLAGQAGSAGRGEGGGGGGWLLVLYG